MNTVRIESLADARVGDYANLRDAELLQREDPANPAGHGGRFIAEGELVVRRLIESAYATKSVLITETRLESMRDALAALPPETPVYTAAQGVVNDVVGFNIHRGVLAIGLRRPAPPLADLLALPGPFLILEDLCNHDNLGAIFRNAAALAGPGSAILLSPRAADPLYRKCIRVSVGNVLSIPFARLADFPDPHGRDASSLRDAGTELWALTPGEGAVPIDRAIAENARTDQRMGKAKIAMMLGSEGPGLSDRAMQMASRRVVIPMHKSHRHVDSLNVGVASAIALFALNSLSVRGRE